MVGHGMLRKKKDADTTERDPAHQGGSAGRWCAVLGSLSAAPPHPYTLCPGCRSCTRRHRPAPTGAPVSSPCLRPGTSAPTCPLLIAHQVPLTPFPHHYHLSSLLKAPAGITEEREGSGWGHFMDGRDSVPQVHSKLLCEEGAQHSTPCGHPSPLASPIHSPLSSLLTRAW